MVNLLSIACIHGDVEVLFKFIDKIAFLNADIIILPGDFTDYNIPKGVTRIDMARIIIEELNTFKKPLLAVPGTWDKELIDFFDKEKISVHGKGRVIDGIGLYGFGGAKTPFNTPYEPSEEEIMSGLEKAYNEIKKCKIKVQITHAPPARTKLDVISSGAHVGSESVRKFIEEKQPNAAICSHIHEGKGIDEIGKTKIINSGRFPEGYCGLVNIENEDVRVKIVNLI
jgi:hypothetical protein